MPRAKKREEQPWLRYIVLPLLLILFGLLISTLIFPKAAIAPSNGIISPTPTPTPARYTCPEEGWVGCMPILSPEAAKNCTPEALTWFTENCPGFQGAAY